MPEPIRTLRREVVRARAVELAEDSSRAWDEVLEARANNYPLAYVSVVSGESLDYVIELARRWMKLAHEMDRAGAAVVEELGNLSGITGLPSLDPRRNLSPETRSRSRGSP